MSRRCAARCFYATHWILTQYQHGNLPICDIETTTSDSRKLTHLATSITSIGAYHLIGRGKFVGHKRSMAVGTMKWLSWFLSRVLFRCSTTRTHLISLASFNSDLYVASITRLLMASLRASVNLRFSTSEFNRFNALWSSTVRRGDSMLVVSMVNPPANRYFVVSVA